MIRKIINILVFAIAGVAGILGLYYAINFSSNDFDGDKLPQYKAISTIHDVNPMMLDSLSNTTTDNLPAFLESYDKTYQDLDNAVKASEPAKVAFYNYIATVKKIDKNNFEAFKAEFNTNTRLQDLLAQFDKEGKYAEEFKKVEKYEDLDLYNLFLEENYNDVRQEYLKKNEHKNAIKVCLDTVHVINRINYANLKDSVYNSYTSSVNDVVSLNKIFNADLYICYAIFGIAILSLLILALVHIITNFKSSYKILFGILAIVVIFVISYLVAGSARSDVFVKLQISPNTARLIEAGCYTVYITFALAIVSVIVSLFSKFKKV